MATPEAVLYFNMKVDPVVLGIPQYFDIIKHPMDLGTVKNKLEGGMYSADTDLFIADVRLVFRNCKCFNGDILEVGQMGNVCSVKFEEWIRNPINLKPAKSMPKSKLYKSSKAALALNPQRTKEEYGDYGREKKRSR